MIAAIVIFLLASIIFSTLVVAACMLSSDISQDESVVEVYEQPIEEAGPAAARS